MHQVPPTVIEYVLPSQIDASWIAPGLHFVTEPDGFGLRFSYMPRLRIGGTYNNTAPTIGGKVADNRWTFGITLMFK
jgi:hypothetical protein